MVDLEINEDERYAILKTDKSKATYRLVKDRSGHRFFEFKIDKGVLPVELQGKYTSLLKGVKAFKQYEKTARKNPAVKRDEWQAEKEAKRAELHSESS